jgi:hypothetical protein
MKPTGTSKRVTRPIGDQELDDAIDRTVRQITSIEPTPGLDRRVLARIEQSGRAPVVMWPRFAAAGLAVAVLLAFVMTRSRTPETLPPPVTTAVTPQPARTPQVDRSVAIARPTPDPAPRHRTRAAAPPQLVKTVRAASVNDADTVVTVAPLEAIAPIEVAPVEPEGMRVSQITIDPIQVRPLRVEPMSSTPY